MQAIQILGVGRSGTTALHALLCRMLEARHGLNGYDRLYEPFLWDARAVADYPLHADGSVFDRLSSLSMEGMYFHQALPLVCPGLAALPRSLPVEALRARLCGVAGERPRLAKYIRANARLGLLGDLLPAATRILVIRNPLATINSVINTFSLFGDDFHASDWPRFVAEARVEAEAPLRPEKATDEVRRSLLWWWHMTCWALRQATGRNDTLVVCHENLVADREGHIRRICDRTGLAFTTTLVDTAAVGVGPTQETRNLTRDEVRATRPFLDAYAGLVEQIPHCGGVDPAAIESRYLRRPPGSRKLFPCRGLSPLSIQPQATAPEAEADADRPTRTAHRLAALMRDADGDTGRTAAARNETGDEPGDLAVALLAPLVEATGCRSTSAAPGSSVSAPESTRPPSC